MTILKKLSIRNFRNIAAADMEFGPGNHKIIGENHVGKTNTLQAVAFLLTDKLLDGTKSLESVKPLNDTSLPVSVEATFDIDGREFSCRKEYKEKWVKTRGTDDVSMQGHEQTLFINGVKQATAKAFYTEIRDAFGLKESDPAGIETMRMLLFPTYLPELGDGKDWVNLRSFIVKLVGDVTDEDVFAGNHDLKPIQADLAAKSGKIDQLKKFYKQSVDSLRSEILAGDAVIDEIAKTPKPTDDEIAVAKAGIEEHESNIARLCSSAGPDARLTILQTQILSKTEELNKAQKAHLEEMRNDPTSLKKAELEEKISKERQAISDQTTERSKLLIQKQSATAKLGSASEGLKEVGPDVNKTIIGEIGEIDKELENPKFEDRCKTCGQLLPPERIDYARESVIRELQSKKNELIEKARSNKAKRAELTQKVNDAESEIKELQSKIDGIDLAIDVSRHTIETLQGEIANLPKPGEYAPSALEASISAEIASLKEEQAKAQEEARKGNYEANAAIIAEQRAEDPFKKVLADNDYYIRQMANLENKKAEVNAKRKSLAEAEQKAEMLNKFIYAKLRMLDENVSKVFGNIRFKLIDENINGGFDPVCKAYIYDSVKGESTKVAWSGGSKSEKVETGIAIVEAVKAATGLPDLPYLFDEGGEISSATLAQRLATKSQLICVKVVDDVMSPTVMPL